MIDDALKGDLLGLKSRVEVVEQEFQDKLKLVEKKEAAFKELDLSVQELLSNEKNKTIKLDIGGKIFITKLSTLLSVKDTVFYRVIGDYICKNQEIPEFLFFDRSFEFFELILNYLRFQQFSLKKYNKYEKEDIKAEVEYYGLSESLSLSKKSDIDIEWDQALSKSGMFTIDQDDKKKIKLHTTTCYTHFVTNKLFKDEDFQIDLEVNVQQSDTYLYVGIYNSSYSLSGNCGCCNPPHAYFVQCDGTTHINSITKSNPNASWKSTKVLISIRVYLSDPANKKIYFAFPEKNDIELGPYTITGNDFRVYAGHCNTGNGEIIIQECFELK